MRSLERNKREFYFATVVSEEPLLDEYGNETLEVRRVYGSPTLYKANIGTNVGQEETAVLGSQTEYSRVICLTICPLKEGDKVWFGVPETGANNYIVDKVADSKNGYLVGLREVSVRE